MESKTFTVPNIGCDGCVKSIKNAVSDLEGVTFVTGDSKTKQVTLKWEPPALRTRRGDASCLVLLLASIHRDSLVHSMVVLTFRAWA